MPRRLITVRELSEAEIEYPRLDDAFWRLEHRSTFFLVFLHFLFFLSGTILYAATAFSFYERAKTILWFNGGPIDALVTIMAACWAGLVTSVFLYFVVRWGVYRHQSKYAFKTADRVAARIRAKKKKSQETLSNEESSPL